MVDNVHALSDEWRRVASTHNLQDLLNDSDDDEPMTNKSKSHQLITKLYSLFFIVSSVAIASLYIWIIVVHFMPLSDNWIIRAVQQDYYCCFLIPLTLPVTAFVASLDWFLLKLIRHNNK